MALVYEKQTIIAMQKVHRRKRKERDELRKKNVKSDASFTGKAPRFYKEKQEEKG